MMGVKTMLSVFVCAAILAAGGFAAAFNIPDLPLAATPRVCASFEEGTPAHDCCLQFPSDDIARRCCTIGFEPEMAESFDCCRENAANGIHPGTPEEPTACEAPDPVTACEEQFPDDDIARRCCEVGFDPADEAAFQCCQTNAHNNVHPGTPENPTACEVPNEETPDDPTPSPTPSEDPPSGGTSPDNPELLPGKCLVTPLDTQVVKGTLIGLNEEGMGIALRIEYILPGPLSGAAHVELSQTSGSEVTWLNPAGLATAESASSYFQWTVQMGRPEKMIGEFIPNAAFLVVVTDAQGKTLHQATCSESAGIHSQGGSGGCSLLIDQKM